MQHHLISKAKGKFHRLRRTRKQKKGSADQGGGKGGKTLSRKGKKRALARSMYKARGGKRDRTIITGSELEGGITH